MIMQIRTILSCPNQQQQKQKKKKTFRLLLLEGHARGSKVIITMGSIYLENVKTQAG